MSVRSGLFVILFVSCLCISTQSFACLVATPSVTEDDLLHPPQNMLAATATIMQIVPHGPLDGMPHLGFTLVVKLGRIFQGNSPEEIVKIEYGPCHSVPGKEGDAISVLALKDKNNNWYAPQFWTRNDAGSTSSIQ